MIEMPETETTTTKRLVWNAGRTVGAKRALFDLAIGSKLRGCDLVRMKIGDIVNAGQIRTRAVVMQQKDNSSCPVRDFAGCARPSARLA